MTKKKSTNTETRRATDEVPDDVPRLPLNGEPWVGYDSAHWIDLALDSRCPSVLLWLRKRVISGQYFLISSCVGGHVMKKEVTREEATYVYAQLPDRAGYAVGFPEEPVKKVDKQAPKSTAKIKPKPKPKPKPKRKS